MAERRTPAARPNATSKARSVERLRRRQRRGTRAKRQSLQHDELIAHQDNHHERIAVEPITEFLAGGDAWYRKRTCRLASPAAVEIDGEA